MTEDRNGSKATRDAVDGVLAAVKKWRNAIAELTPEDREPYVSSKLSTNMGDINYALSLIEKQ